MTAEEEEGWVLSGEGREALQEATVVIKAQSRGTKGGPRRSSRHTLTRGHLRRWVGLGAGCCTCEVGSAIVPLRVCVGGLEVPTGPRQPHQPPLAGASDNCLSESLAGRPARSIQVSDRPPKPSGGTETTPSGKTVGSPRHEHWPNPSRPGFPLWPGTPAPPGPHGAQLHPGHLHPGPEFRPLALPCQRPELSRADGGTHT